MKKKKKVIILLVILFVFAGVITTGVLILEGSKDDSFDVVYELDEDRVTFYAKYNNLHCLDLKFHNENDAVVEEDVECRRKNSNIFNKWGVIKRKEVVSFKVKGKGVTEVGFNFLGRYTDDAHYILFKIQVTDTGFHVEEVERSY